MAPANQRFEARDPALLEVDERLIIELKVAVLDRPAQIELQASARFRLIAHTRFKEPIDSASVGFGAVHREIGSCQQRRRIIVAVLRTAMPMLAPTKT